MDRTVVCGRWHSSNMKGLVWKFACKSADASFVNWAWMSASGHIGGGGTFCDFIPVWLHSCTWGPVHRAILRSKKSRSNRMQSSHGNENPWVLFPSGIVHTKEQEKKGPVQTGTRGLQFRPEAQFTGKAGFWELQRITKFSTFSWLSKLVLALLDKSGCTSQLRLDPE